MRGLVISAEWNPRNGYVLTDQEKRSHRVRKASDVFQHPRLSVSERPDPELSGPHDVLIRNIANGVCGSDLYLVSSDVDGYMKMPAPLGSPVAIGHEYSGVVLEVGAGVTRVTPGDIVAVEAQVECGVCRACLRGLRAVCERLLDRGLTLDGGTATYSVAHERHCWPLTQVIERHGETRAYDIGALVEPASVAYNGMIDRAGGFRPGDTVAVFGAGPIGLAAVGLANALGAGRVLCIDPLERKREIATVLGATESFDPAAGGLVDAILDATDGHGVDMAVDATGAGRQVIPTVADIIGVGAKIVSLGANMVPVEVDTLKLMFRAASVHFTMGHLGGGFPAVIALNAAGRIDLTPMITARYDLDDGVKAIAKAAEGEEAKVMIYPNGQVGHVRGKATS